MTLDQIQMEINDRGITAGETAKPIYHLMGELALIVKAIDQRTSGGIPQDELVLVLKAKIAELDGLLNNNAKIFQQIKDVIGADDATAAELPARIKALLAVK